MRKYLSSIVALACIAAVVLLFSNKQYVRDLYVVSTNTVQPSALAIKNELSLTKSADFIYRASLPEIQESVQFNKSCKDVNREQSIVLGCYSSQQIFVFNVDDPRLTGVKEVTAAHELLHAVYERMSTSERSKIDKLLLDQAKTITDERFNQTLEDYKKTEPGQIANELHSILGTEIADLSPELEQHYSKYFNKRENIVGLANQYAGTFKSLDDQIKTYDDQLKNLKATIDTSQTRLDQQSNTINQFQSNMNYLKSRDEIGQYNALVPRYNALVVTFNSNIEKLKNDISAYNDIVEKRNSLATTQNDLSQHLNSNYQPIN